MKWLFLSILSMFLVACSNLQPKTIVSSDLGIQDRLIFARSEDEVTQAIKEAISEKGWKLLYEGERLPDSNYGYTANNSLLGIKSHDPIAWQKAVESGVDPVEYIQAKTPTSAFSFGAELYIVVFKEREQSVAVSISASTGQIREKDKLEAYIKYLSEALERKLDK